MLVGKTGGVSARLMLLKDLDSVVDFSRASNQFAIILYLAERSELVSVGDLARITGDTRKSILDSLRKLEKKDLIEKIERNGELYVGLSETGREFVKKLLEVLSPPQTPESEVLDTPVRLNISKELVTSINLYRLIVHAGLSGRGYVPLRDAPRIILEGERNMDIIIESFTRNPTRFFKMAKAEGEDVLLLDKQGVELLKKTPHYRAYHSNPVYKLMVGLTGSPWMSEIAGKTNAALGGASLVSIILALLLESPALLIVGAGSSALILGFNLLFSRLGFIDTE
ncbi:MAG: hypothetical protein QW182_02655 [Thermosphaera sp.]